MWGDHSSRQGCHHLKLTLTPRRQPRGRGEGLPVLGPDVTPGQQGRACRAEARSSSPSFFMCTNMS